MITTRLATPDDLAVILELIHLKAAFDGVPGSVTANVDSLRETLFSPTPEAHVLLAESDGKVLGMASFHRHFSTFITRPGVWLDDLYIREEHRNQGAGEVLMARLAQICLEWGGARIEWTVAARNAHGIRFYERMGATVFQGTYLARLSGDSLKSLASAPSSQG